MIRISILILLAVLFSSCENSTDVSIDLPYHEYTVIDAQLIAYHVFEGVTITHTLPMGVQYNIQEAEIKNAIAYMVENGIRIIPLHYTSNGIYKPENDITIKAHSRYELYATLDDKSIYSETVVPDIPDIISVSDIDNNYLSAEVQAKPDEAYGAAWIISESGNSLVKANDFFSIEIPDHYPSDVIVRTQDIPPPYNNPSYSGNLYIQVYAFDKAYKDYFITKTNSNPVNNTFTSGGGSVIWNIYGDNTIGLFIGLCEGYIIQP